MLLFKYPFCFVDATDPEHNPVPPLRAVLRDLRRAPKSL